MIRSSLLAVLTLCSLSAAQDKDQWNQFRGPGGLSVADDTPIPTSFGPAENVLWKSKLPAGHSSPCIVGKRIFLTGFEDGKHIILALDRMGGKELWRKSFAEGAHPPYAHPDAQPAQSTPVSNGERVVAYFSSHGLVAFDMQGKVLWEKPLTPAKSIFGDGSSPVLYEGLVILNRDATAEAAIMVYDLVDGSEVFRINRFEYGASYGTPFLWRNAERDELVVSGTNTLCSYDLIEGNLLWKVNGLTDFPCTTPTADKDTLYYAAWSTYNAEGRSFWEAGFTRSLELSDEEVQDPSLLFKRLDTNNDGKVVRDEVPESRFKDAYEFLDLNQSGAWEVEELVAPPTTGSGKNLMVAVRRGAEGDASETHVRWTSRRGLPYVASPLLYRDRVWLFKSGGIVSALEASSGKPSIDQERLEDRSEYYLSPVGAAGHILAGSAKGTLYVIDARAEKLTIEHQAKFDEELFATPAVLDGIVYLRTKSTMWAFGKAQE